MPTLVIHGGPLNGWRLDVDRPLVLGRGNADVRVEDPRMSRRHVGLRPLGDGTLEVIDMRSANGTFVNGRRVAERTVVRPGDRVDAGSTSMVFEAPVLAPASAAAAPAAAFALTGPSARGAFRPHRGLRTRMVLTMAVLALLYLVVLALVAVGGAYYWIFAALAIGIALFQTLAADRIALSALRARVVTPAEAPELHGIVDRLCIQSGTPKPRVAIAANRAPNAMAVGRSREKATVVVTTGLMELLEPAELEGVVAHELSHVHNRDVMVMTIAGFLMIAAWWCVMLHRASWRFFGVIVLCGLVVWGLSRLMVLALSRYREFVADEDAARVTGRPSALASALLKVSGDAARIPRRDLRRISGMSAFMIVPTGARGLFSTHPPVERRVAALQAIERELQG
jgi:heat shock protein HtpX